MTSIWKIYGAFVMAGAAVGGFLAAAQIVCDKKWRYKNIALTDVPAVVLSSVCGTLIHGVYSASVAIVPAVIFDMMYDEKSETQ
jgi:hypothetical protein